mgnify:CR=1 FL=1
MENTTPDNMDPWNRIISKIIDSPSPIIAAVITTIIAGLSAYIAWRTYKKSLVGTPPELLKYDKWLDVVEKRNSLKNDNLSSQDQGGSRDEDFDEALKLYGGNAIWESMVINNVPRGRVRKFLLKLDAQVILDKDREEIPSEIFTVKGLRLILFTCLISLILLQIIFTVLYVIYISCEGGDRGSSVLFVVIYVFWGGMFLVTARININIVPEIAKLYCYKMNKISPKGLPGFWELYPRVIYKDFIVQNNLFFSEVSSKKWQDIKYGIRSVSFMIAFFFYGLFSLDGVIVSINVASQLKFDSIFSGRYDLYNLFGIRDLNIGTGYVDTIEASLIYFIIYCILIFLLYIKCGSEYLVESELKMTNGQWKSGSKRVYIENGVIKIEDSKTNSIKEKSLSIREMRNMFNSKKTKIFKCVKFISRDTANKCVRGSTIESSTLIIEYEGQSIKFYPEKFKSE